MSSNSKDWKDILDMHFDKRLRDLVHTSFPAKITRVVNSNVVDVLPLITTQRPDKSVQPYPELFDVRMQSYACQLGDVYISLPIQVGDLVWVMVSERDTAKLMASNGATQQNATTQVTHDMSDCFAIPAFFPDGNLKDYDPDNLVIANKTTKITIKQDSVVIDTNNYELNASEATVTADNTTVNGTLQVTQEISSQTSVEAPAYIVNGLQGATGIFTTSDGKTVIVTNGLITSII